jgi:hypothetical protein
MVEHGALPTEKPTERNDNYFQEGPRVSAVRDDESISDIRLYQLRKLEEVTMTMPRSTRASVIYKPFVLSVSCTTTLTHLTF